MSPEKLAKKVVEAYIKTGEPLSNYSCSVQGKAGVFVTIKKNGKLMGCMGTVSPTKKDIEQEIISSAIAACEDPRFPVISINDLSFLDYEVNILEKPQKITTIAELDPQKYGVMVKTDTKSALLLPGLKGINTTKKQLNIVRKKAGINSNEHYEIFKFITQKYAS